MNMIKKTLSLVILILIALISNAQQTAEKFIQETHYLLYLPEGYKNDTTTQWPLMIFLHGSGESGVDLDKVKVHGPPKLIEAGKKFPFIVVSPQAPPQTGWQAETLKAMLDDLKKKYRVDRDRIYLTGLSMGGFGTWDLSEKYPNEFAAIAPICGGGDTSKIWKLRHMPVWCFHGAKDDVVPLASSQRMVDALRPYNPSVKFTIYPEANHNSWEVTYNNDSLYTWLLSQKKFRYTAINPDQKILKEYEGAYLTPGNDTLRMEIEDGKLYAKPKQGKIELKASSATNFFWNENAIDEVQFVRNKKGVISGFIVLGDDKEEARKIPTSKTK
ncbi:MAG: dienelactone hydrolase family protein [Agriterribacter sp.]